MYSKVIFIVLIVATLAACKKSKDNSNNVIGRWKLTEVLADPGDGSGTWQPALVYGVPLTTILELSADGTVKGDHFYFPDTFDRYYTEAGSKIYFIKTSTNDTFEMRYTLERGKLTINPQCIEPCGYRFVKVFSH